MKIKTALAALALTLALAPALAMAEGCRNDTMKQQASSCVEGAVWDAQKGQCVVQPSS